MIVNSTEMQNNFGKYLDLAGGQEITIMKNGKAVARLLGIEEVTNFLSEKLLGIVPNDISLEQSKSERLARQ